MNKQPRQPCLLASIGGLLAAVACAPVFAQGYPRLSSEQFARATARMQAADKRSDEIFAQQLPLIE